MRGSILSRLKEHDSFCRQTMLVEHPTGKITWVSTVTFLRLRKCDNCNMFINKSWVQAMVVTCCCERYRRLRHSIQLATISCNSVTVYCPSKYAGYCEMITALRLRGTFYRSSPFDWWKTKSRKSLVQNHSLVLAIFFFSLAFVALAWLLIISSIFTSNGTSVTFYRSRFWT